jgi:hypothetical protein
LSYPEDCPANEFAAAIVERLPPQTRRALTRSPQFSQRFGGPSLAYRLLVQWGADRPGKLFLTAIAEGEERRL